MARWLRWLLVAVVLAAVGAYVVAYLRTTDVSKNYVQTWPKSYETTTCAEWNDDMSDDQRFAAAADLWWEELKSRGATDRPDYDEVVSYQSAIRQECERGSSVTLTKVAATFGFD